MEASNHLANHLLAEWAIGKWELVGGSGPLGTLLWKVCLLPRPLLGHFLLLAAAGAAFLSQAVHFVVSALY